MAAPWVMRRPTMILFGDSITQRGFEPETSGWAAKLANHFTRKADIINRGFSGYNTRWAKYLLPHALPANLGSPGPGLVTIFFGANDASLSNINPNQHVPLHEYANNLRSIIEHVRDTYGLKTQILVISPPPIDEAQRIEYQKAKFGKGATGVLERTDKSAGEYAAECQAVGDALAIPVLDLWKAMHHAAPDPGGVGAFLCDGLHLSAKGNIFVFEKLLACIEQEFPEMVADTLPWEFPLVGDIDWEHPEDTFGSDPPVRAPREGL